MFLLKSERDASAELQNLMTCCCLFCFFLLRPLETEPDADRLERIDHAIGDGRRRPFHSGRSGSSDCERRRHPADLGRRKCGRQATQFFIRRSGFRLQQKQQSDRFCADGGKRQVCTRVSDWERIRSSSFLIRFSCLTMQWLFQHVGERNQLRRLWGGGSFH